MSDTTAGLLQAGALIAALALAYRPLGGYMARVFTSERDLRVERATYRLVGVDSKADQRWSVYATSVIAFSLVSVVALYALQRVQDDLPLSLGFPGVDPALAFNTAASFVTNTNWQAYSGEATMGHLTQMAGLAVQNFVSAAVGIAVVVAVIRGFTRSKTDRIGNFWVDLVRCVVRILLPISVIGAIALIALGAIQNLSSGTDVTTLVGGHQTLTGGPVASQEAIKELGTNGGGFYNANSSHPFESPNALSNLLENFLLLLIPVALTRTFGDHGRRQAPGLRHPRRDGRDLGHPGHQRDRCSRSTTRAPPSRPPARPWRARRPGWANGPRRCSLSPPRVRRPARSTRSTTRSRASAAVR